MVKTYSHKRLRALQQEAQRLHGLTLDVADRMREVQIDLREAVRVRDGQRDREHRGIREFPNDPKEQKRREQKAADMKERLDYLTAEYEKLSKAWTTAARIAARAEEYVKAHKLEPRDAPIAEESPFKPKRIRDSDWVQPID